MMKTVEHAPLARHSAIAHAAYIDLRRSLSEEVRSDLRGTPTRVTRNGRIYWYDSFRIGSEVRKRYIGEDGPELQALLAARDSRREDRHSIDAHRARLIRILRAEGFTSIDATSGSLLAALARAGVFRLGGTLVGTHAFRLYEGELGVRYGFDEAAQTDDLDIASFERLSLALDDAVSEPLQDVLRDFSFEPVPSLEQDKAWRWKQTRSDLLVEFLTPSFAEDEGLRPLPALGVHARALHHLNYLIAAPLKAAVPYRSGVLVQIPQPERFAIHKLIVADRRREGPQSLKAHKDRAQAAFLIRALAEDRPEDLREALSVARETGARWRGRIDASLARMPQTAAILAALG